MGRFINMDSCLNFQDGILGYNTFVYCLNNPINGMDPCGTCFHQCDFWNDCEKCRNKSIVEKWNNSISETLQMLNLLQAQVSKSIEPAVNSISQVVRDLWDDVEPIVKKTESEVVGVVKSTFAPAIDRFSTPEKAANTLGIAAGALGLVSAYSGGIAAGLSIPTFGMSVPTAGTVSVVTGIGASILGVASSIINIFNEE